MTIRIRSAATADLAEAGAICHDAFKAIADAHSFPPDFPDRDAAQGLLAHLVTRADVLGLVAEKEGQVVGSNFLWQGAVGGIGPITVQPGAQNAGVGRLLMEAALEQARKLGIPSVRLVQAGYHTRSLSLYTKLGFVPREPLAVMQGAPTGGSIHGYTVRPGSKGDVERANELCARVHGHTRATEFLDGVAQGTAAVVEFEGRLTGYASAIGFFGHAVGERDDDLKALIMAAPAFAGPGFMVPIRNASLFRWCLQQGLRVVQPMTLMSTGFYNEPQGAWLPSVLF